jgi:lon-related putative ATP-dependent protease
MAISPFELPPESLANRCDPDELGFETTADVEPLTEVVGQERAIEAIRFALDVDGDGYNLYVAGPPGTGRNTVVRSHAEKMAAMRPVPPDICYVHNFKERAKPVALTLPAGQGRRLAAAMDRFIEVVLQEMPRAFESERYEQMRAKILIEVQQKKEALFQQLQKVARDMGFSIEMTPTGIVTIPVVEGRPVSREAYELLPEEMRRSIQQRAEALQLEIGQALRKARQLDSEALEAIRKLDQDVALSVVAAPVEELKGAYREHPKVLQFLDAVQQDIVENLDDFRPQPGEARGPDRLERLNRFKVNVLVDNSSLSGAPVVVEHNPTYYNLFGRVDYRAIMGALVTDHTLIRAGAVHRANGGYLIVQAKDLFLNFMAWEGLKRTLRSGQLRIENLAEQFSPYPGVTLQPEPVPISVKVIMVGPMSLYPLLYALEDDFRKYFKVKADFAWEMSRDTDQVRWYASFVASRQRELELKPFHKTAVARIVDHGSRMLEHNRKLSTRFSEIADLVTEANYWATKDGSDLVLGQHVQKAIEARTYRSNLLEEKIQELIRDNTIMIRSEGSVVGQVNGLSILDLGDYYFGRPSRISARTYVGSEGIVNIEREIEMSGRIHSKGVMILSNFLSARYGQDFPISLSASITFEQTYDEVEGDSASSAELYALLSSLAEVPIRQNLAVTGAVDQYGEIQPVGGVTRKIEGFFDICRQRGLTGDHGVIIPRRNVANLMLREDVVEAVRQGKFHIYAVDHVDQGIELLTGMPAGERLSDGTWPQGTINYLVEKKLRDYASRMKEFGKGPGDSADS